MTIDDALNIVLNDLNVIMIPASEAEKMTKVKTNILEVITAVRNDRAMKQQAKEGQHDAD
jgi:hypothetical protein